IPQDILTRLEIVEEIRFHTGSLASHVTGYIKKPRNPMQPQDGLAGLERYFNDELWATPTAVGVIIDAKGKMVPGLGINEWEYDHIRRPYDVVTTIDRNLQSLVESVGGGNNPLIKKGAVVLLEPHTGDIVTMASFPRLPVEMLYEGATQQQVEQMQINEPHLNRAIMQYPIGSVFKVVLSAAALEQDLQEPDGLFICDGAYEVGNRTIRCYGDTAHGVVDIHQALAVSCNGYFVQLAEILGKETFLNMARRFKLGQTTDIPLGSEMPGKIPAAMELPYPGDVANAAIGQGLVAATPIQLARMMASIVNDGRDIYPRLVSQIIDKNGNSVQNYPVQYGTRVFSPSITKDLKTMLKTVVTGGSARGAYSPLYQASGKSGTAETSKAGISHSWFVGYVTTRESTLVAVVFLEEWQENDLTASSVFRRIMERIVLSQS
ncbi:MAG: penicillin-binding protein 2, partial [Firmicutes bacterium]|nr:penicillin-binding protein 2 [Bacillota bacterium]